MSNNNNSTTILKHDAFIIRSNDEELITLIPFDRAQLVRMDEFSLYLHTSNAKLNWEFSEMFNEGEVREQIDDYFSQFNFGADAITSYHGDNP